MKAIMRELIIEGIDCANCAAKIEYEVGKITGVSSASLNFSTKKLTLETDIHEDIGVILNQVSKVAKRIESGVNIIESDSDSHSDIHGKSTLPVKKAIVFGIGLLASVSAFLLSLPFPLKLILYLSGYLLIGGEILVRAVKNIIRGQVFDENFLMVLATIGAFAIGEYPEGIAVMVFYQIGEFFQEMAVHRSRRSISELMNIKPDYANLLSEGKIVKVPPGDVPVGAQIIIKPGEKVPLDGVVVEGGCALDTSALTGESAPREVVPGDEVLSGFINKNGVLKVTVTKKYSESAVSKILSLVEQAGNRKAPTENFITRFAKYYTPAVVLSSIAVSFLPPLLIQGASLAEWVNRALVFLVVSCPCALVLSIPLGFFGGIGGASRNGILVKGGNYLEAMNDVDTIIFDKTGTLTKGTFKVSRICPNGVISQNELLEYAAYAEAYSNHPIALSIMKAYSKDIDKSRISKFNEVPGYGIKAQVAGKSIAIGNHRLMELESIRHSEAKYSGTAVHLAVDGVYSGYLLISDQLKDDSVKALKELRSIGINSIAMFTGDNRAAAEEIGNRLGMDEVYPELLPHQKVEQLEALYNSNDTKGKLMFVGDGINDAPVLARADIGVAMGGLGSDAAIEAADVVLMTDEPYKLVTALKVARKTKRIVWQNIIFSFSVKALVLFLGAGGLTTMWEAVFADVGVALIAIFNTMRVLKTDRKR